MTVDQLPNFNSALNPGRMRRLLQLIVIMRRAMYFPNGMTIDFRSFKDLPDILLGDLVLKLKCDGLKASIYCVETATEDQEILFYVKIPMVGEPKIFTATKLEAMLAGDADEVTRFLELCISQLEVYLEDVTSPFLR